MDWFEIISENFMVPGGRPLAMLEKIRARYPVVMHGVSLSLGSTDPLDQDYLRDLKALADRIEPALISDHLAWTGVGGVNLHDLLPIPYTRDALTHVVERVARVQDVLGRRLLVENPSTYVRFADADMDEASFIAELARRAIACCCSTSTTCLYRPLTTASTLTPICKKCRRSAWRRCISPAIPIAPPTRSTPTTNRSARRSAPMPRLSAASETCRR